MSVFFFAFLGFPYYLLCVNIYWFQSERGLNFWIFLKVHLLMKKLVFLVSELEEDDESVRWSYITVPYTLLVIFGSVCVTDAVHVPFSGTRFLGAKCLFSVYNRKWQEATQQIQTLQASQSLLAEYEQKIKVRHWGLYKPCFDFFFSLKISSVSEQKYPGWVLCLILSPVH